MLTEIEKKCGVSERDVIRERARSLVFDHGQAVAIAGNIGPAIAGAVARLSVGPIFHYSGTNSFGHSVYRKGAA